MANRIKGITVEIGGDTTKLDKALKGTNKEISDTQRNLKDVERLLKMDPGNMDLLAQKQGYLADKAALTKEKYDQLKTALDNATASNANFEKWEKAQAELQGQITKSENALKDLEAEAKKLQQQGFAPDSSEMKAVQEQIEATKNRTEDLRKELTETFDELGRPISMEQFKSLQRETFAAGEAAKDAEREYKNFNAELDAFSAKADKVSDKAGEIAKATAGISKVSAAALAGVGALAGKAVKNYAETEQLVGGVETLFKNASDTVLQNAKNAYKTAGLTQNEYLETVTGFSASLIQSLGGDTVLAANIADKAITDMADNANKMGTSIESIQYAYQGFAKQNYTMLDNLKLGYGGTKEEMERLLADAEQLSGLKFDISSFSDIINAINVIQSNLDITGTTAKEASETISGSFEMTKSAIDNLIGGLADADADVQQLTQDVIDSGSAFLKNLMPVLEQIWANIPAVGKLAIVFLTIGAVISPVASSISAVAGVMSKASIILPALTNGLSALAGGFSTVGGFLATKIAAILPTVTSGFSALWAVISANPIGAILTLITALIAAFVYFYKTNDEFREKVQAAWEAVKETVLGVVDAIKNAINTISNLPGKITGMFSSGTSDSRVRGFASGGVFMPNSPVLGILGDNRNEREVAAPESTLMEIFGRALDARGSSGSAQTINIQFSGSLAQLGRVLQPVVTTETARQGVNLIK